MDILSTRRSLAPGKDASSAAPVGNALEQLSTARREGALVLAPGMRLVIEPRSVSSLKEFLRKRPRHWVTLDGRITAEPVLIRSRPFWNADHHYGVDRLRTPCTAKQVYRGIRQRPSAFAPFRLAGRIRMSIAVNDCDFDVCFALWLLKNHQEVKRKDLPRHMLRLLDLQDRIDRRGGCIPLDSQSHLMRAMAWMNEPFEEAKRSGLLCKMTAHEMSLLISETMQRIDRFAQGSGEERAVDGRYRRLEGGGKGWLMIEEQGLYARGCLTKSGVKAFVSVSQRAAGHWGYSLWRVQRGSDFEVGYLYQVLNAAEGLRDGGNEAWGGSREGGGSPRGRGSFLSPQQLTKIINEYLNFARKPANGFNQTSVEVFIRVHLPQILEQPPRAA